MGSTSGYVWLFIVCGILMLRLIFDGYFTRRPRLEQNLNTPGLTFLCAVAFVFLSIHAWTSDEVPASTVQTVEAAGRLLKRQEAPAKSANQRDLPSDDAKAGPAAAVLTAPIVSAIPQLAATISAEPKHAGSSTINAVYAARIASIIAHLLVIAALVCIGRWHFGDQPIGMAMAALYMLLPCTSYDVGRLNHVLPAALIVGHCTPPTDVRWWPAG